MDLNYTIRRSPKRRKLTITVERDSSVVVHAPKDVSEEKIRQVVESRRQWIHEKIHHPQKYRNLPHPPGKELVSGESAHYLGRQYRIEIVQKGLLDVEFNQRFLVPAFPGMKRMEALKDWYVVRARKKIMPRVKARARELGVDIGAVKIVDNRYRWGSCTTHDNVNINWRLIKAPMIVIDYVIIHELAHLIEANHTPRFWNIVRTHVPAMDKAKNWLKEHGQMLEQAI